jgi:hypothetical protein
MGLDNQIHTTQSFLLQNLTRGQEFVIRRIEGLSQHSFEEQRQKE